MKQHARAKNRNHAATKAARKPAQRKQEEAQTKKKAGKPAYLQKKMAVSSPGDAQEQEADRVAEEVSRKPKGVSRQAEGVQRASAVPDGNPTDEQSLQAKPQITRMEDSEACLLYTSDAADE